MGELVAFRVLERGMVWLQKQQQQQLVFDPRCGAHAAVVNGGTTAHRPNAQSDFNHGVVLTARPLRAGELFEVVLDQVLLLLTQPITLVSFVMAQLQARQCFSVGGRRNRC